jgi:hypothetical protein
MFPDNKQLFGTVIFLGSIQIIFCVQSNKIVSSLESFRPTGSRFLSSFSFALV